MEEAKLGTSAATPPSLSPVAARIGNVEIGLVPNARRGGLLEAIDVLKDVQGLSFVYFDEDGVVRHHLVQRIIRADDEHKTRAKSR